MSTITVAAVQLWSDTSRTPDENRNHAFEMAEHAAKRQPDLVVLPEAVSMLCYPDGRPSFTYHDVADPIPGPTFDRFAEIAGRYQTNLVVGMIEERGPTQTCQNTAIVFDRSGSLIGRYDKIHEPAICRDEQAAAVGRDVPLFDLDLGRIGIMVCWDLISPEFAALLGHKGAQLICLPHLIGLPSVANFAVQVRARAIDSGVPVVAAGMRDAHNHNGTQEGVSPTCIIDADGHVIGQSDVAREDVVYCDVEIDNNSGNARHVSRRREDLRFDIYAREYTRLAER